MKKLLIFLLFFLGISVNQTYGADIYNTGTIMANGDIYTTGGFYNSGTITNTGEILNTGDIFCSTGTTVYLTVTSTGTTQTSSGQIYTYSGGYNNFFTDLDLSTYDEINQNLVEIKIILIVLFCLYVFFNFYYLIQDLIGKK